MSRAILTHYRNPWRNGGYEDELIELIGGLGTRDSFSCLLDRWRFLEILSVFLFFVFCFLFFVFFLEGRQPQPVSAADIMVLEAGLYGVIHLPLSNREQ